MTKSLTYGIGARLKNVENYDKKIGQNLGSNEFSYDLDVVDQYLSSGPCQNRRMWTTKNEVKIIDRVPSCSIKDDKKSVNEFLSSNIDKNGTLLNTVFRSVS